MDSRATSPAQTADGFLSEAGNFSLVLGGPLYQLFVKARLGDDVTSRVKMRVVIVCAIIWLPLLLLCAVSGTLTGGVDVPFLVDIETHVRFLVVVPLLIVAELLVHQRMRSIVPQFLERKLVPDAEMERFRDAIRSTIRWRNSLAVEVFIIAVVYTVGYYLRSDVFALKESTWYASIGPSGATLTLPGYWMTWVSNPVLQFLLLRWTFRIILWARFLYKVSRIDLALLPTHPDRNGGLGFLGASAYACTPLLTALGAGVAGLVASRIFHEGAKLTDFRMEILVVVIVGMVLAVGPVTVFAPRILEAKRRGLRELGALAADYSIQFDRRWIRTADHEGETLLGAADIQSLADLGNSFQIVREMRAVPFTRDTLVQLTVATVAPFVPLIFTMFPVDELLNRVFAAVF